MVAYRDLVNELRDLGLDGSHPIIAHSSLSAFGYVQGGAETLVGAMLAVSKGVIMPTFTYQCMVTPKTGPPNNGMTYGSGIDTNRMAQFFHPGLPADPLIGSVAESLRRHPDAQRSRHPIYSFSGVDANEVLDAQTLAEPFAPIRLLTEARGLVLLMGVNHTANTSIHYGEQLAGRRQFVRWALTPQGIQECPRWPNCSYGFQDIAPWIASSTRETQIGAAQVHVIPLEDLIAAVQDAIAKNALALLCNNLNCERCQAIRADRR
jgi:aminoglycoside 3-N-acetyltransferase